MPPTPADEVQDPATSPTRLAELAASHPELHQWIAAHPNVYPDLVAWLQQYGTVGPAAPAPTASAPAAPAAPRPVRRRGLVVALVAAATVVVLGVAAAITVPLLLQGSARGAGTIEYASAPQPAWEVRAPTAFAGSDDIGLDLRVISAGDDLALVHWSDDLEPAGLLQLIDTGTGEERWQLDLEDRLGPVEVVQVMATRTHALIIPAGSGGEQVVTVRLADGATTSIPGRIWGIPGGAGDSVLTVVGEESAQTLVRVGLDGSEQWSIPVDESLRTMGYGASVLVLGPVAYSLESGAPVTWEVQAEHDDGYYSSGDHLVAILDGGYGRVDESTGRIGWEVALPTFLGQSMDGSALVFCDDDTCHGFDAATGSERWSATRHHENHTFYTPSALRVGDPLGDRIVFVSEDGQAQVVDVRSGATAALRLPDGGEQLIGAGERTIYSTTMSSVSETLYAVDTTTGAVRWSIANPAPETDSRFQSAGGRIILIVHGDLRGAEDSTPRIIGFG